MTSNQSNPSSNLETLKLEKYFFGFVVLVLLTTSLAKLWMLVFDPFVDLKTGYPVLLLASAVVVELGLVYIILTKAPITKLAVTMLVFCVFLAVSLFRLVNNEQSCGCFGLLDVSPLVTTSLNLIILLTSVWIGYRKLGGAKYALNHLRSVEIQNKECQSFLKFVGLAIGLVVLTLVGESPWIKQSVSILTNSETVLIATSQNIGGVDSGPAFVKVRISNSSDQPATIVGSTSSCSCTTSKADGIIVPANGSVEISVKVTRKRAGKIHQRVRFFFSHPHQFLVDADIIGWWNY